jgi:hypothetical protein
MNRNFEMTIEDIFHLSNGRIVFVGEIPGSDDIFIRSCSCKLIINGIESEELIIEDEMIAGKRTRNKLRSLSTLKKVKLTHEFVKTNDCKIRNW